MGSALHIKACNNAVTHFSCSSRSGASAAAPIAIKFNCFYLVEIIQRQFKKTASAVTVVKIVSVSSRHARLLCLFLLFFCKLAFEKVNCLKSRFLLCALDPGHVTVSGGGPRGRRGEGVWFHC